MATVTLASRIVVYEGAEALDLAEWRDLLARDSDRHVFATPEWNRLWWEEFHRGKDLFALTMRRDEELFGVAPLYRKHEGDRKILRWIGGIDLTDYLGPICSRDDRRDVADTLAKWLGETEVEWDEFDAHSMPGPFGFSEFLAEAADRHGFSVSIEEEETSALVRLPPRFDDYLAALPSKDRHELKRKRRRISREHPDATIRRATSDTLDRDMEIFVDMHRGAEGLKGHFMRPDIATFFERVARALDRLGWLHLDFLEVAGRPLATTFSFEYNGTFYLYNSAFDQEWRHLSPGVILVSYLIERSIEEGLSRFDMLRGPERYKYQLGAEAISLHNVRIFNRNGR